MSARRFSISVDIAATPQHVWNVLADVEAWPTWTPTMTKVEGIDGSELKWGAAFTIKQPGLMKAKYVVTELTDGESFTWYNSVAGNYIVAGHTLKQVSEAVTNLTLSFEVSGLFAAFTWLLVQKKVREFVTTEAESLKAVCE